METSDAIPSNAMLPSRGWLIAFVMIGGLMMVDGVGMFLEGGLASAALAEAAGKVLAGGWMAAFGTTGLRGGRALQGRGPAALAILATILYGAGALLGSAWWASVIG